MGYYLQMSDKIHTTEFHSACTEAGVPFDRSKNGCYQCRRVCAAHAAEIAAIPEARSFRGKMFEAQLSSLHLLSRVELKRLVSHLLTRYSAAQLRTLPDAVSAAESDEELREVAAWMIIDQIEIRL